MIVEDGTDPTDPTDPTDRLVDYWTGLDRGWQALWFGLVIVSAHLAVQSF